MLKESLEQFVNELVNAEKSDNTISSYRNDIMQFIDFIGERNLTKKIVIEYKKQLEKQRNPKGDLYKPASINRKLIAINKFISFIGKDDSKVKVNKVPKKQFIEDVLTVEEVESLINTAKECKDFRAAAIITTLAHTGLRVSELVALTVDDEDQEMITVKGKGDKPRDILMSDKVREALQEYFVHERSNHNHAPNKALFIGQRGAMTRASVDAIIKDYCESCGIHKDKAHAHAFRHYTALRLVDNGLDIGSIADVLGHADIATTAIYTMRSKEQIKEFMNKI